MNENTLQQSPAPALKIVIGRCDYPGCGQEAYYRIDLDCDDISADVCNKHHDAVLTLFGLPDCESGE